MSGGMIGSGFGGFFGVRPHQPRAGIHFHLTNPEEQQEVMHAFAPMYRNFECGHCGRSTNGRVLCSQTDEKDNVRTLWCQCSCERQLPTVIVNDGESEKQFPEYCRFQPGEKWPSDLTRLYEEATRSFSACAYTSTTMVCRKMLMVCACQEGADEGLQFAKYVDYIIENVLPLPRAKGSIDAIRTNGNDANHSVSFVSRDDAQRALAVITYLLNSVYSLPQA
jgi:hypothetical protein